MSRSLNIEEIWEIENYNDIFIIQSNINNDVIIIG